MPRANRIDLQAPAEVAIRKAINSVEELNADPRLTDAIVLLSEAKRLVSQYIDEQIKEAL